MTYDDDPYNGDDGRAQIWYVVKIVLVTILACAAIIMLLSYTPKAKAQDNSYLPPRYRNIPAQQPQAAEPTEEPTEYYAEDWIMKDARGRVVCRDPYVRKDLKIVECVGADTVR